MKIALKSIIIILSLISAFCFSQNTDSSDLLITKRKLQFVDTTVFLGHQTENKDQTGRKRYS